MARWSILHETWRDLILYYLERLRLYEQLYETGGAESYTALQNFELDAGQIDNCRQYAINLAEFYPEVIQLCGDFALAGRSLVSLRQTPRQRITFQKAVLGILESVEREYEGRILVHLCADYSQVGEFEQAVTYGKRAIRIARLLNDLRLEKAARLNLGTVYINMGNVGDAEENYQFSDTNTAHPDDAIFHAARLGGLGSTEMMNGNPEQAEEYFRQALQFAESAKNLEMKAAFLNNLALTYLERKQLNKALEYARHGLETARGIGDKRTEGDCLGQIGTIYFRKKQYGLAIQYYTQAIDMAGDIEDRLGTANRYNNLGNAYTMVGNSEKAVQFLEKAQSIFAELGKQDWVRRVDRLLAFNRDPSTLPRRLVSRLLNRSVH